MFSGPTRKHRAVELHPPFSPDDHVRGLRGAPNLLVVYGDYECPVSGRLWRVLHEMRGRNAPVCEVFRHYPMTGVHPHAFRAASAAEAAADQKMFWQMHDMMFEHQDALEISDLGDYAKTLGLDVERFDEDVAYGNFDDAVRADQRSGVSSGVKNTPTVFLNGSVLELPEPEKLPELIAE
jgi:protein-disulfide isomerase